MRVRILHREYRHKYTDTHTQIKKLFLVLNISISIEKKLSFFYLFFLEKRFYWRNRAQ